MAGPLHGVNLEKAIELSLVAPGAVVVIVVNLPCSGVDDGGIDPVWQPDDQAADLAAEELSGAGDRRRQLKAATRGADCREVANLGLDCHDVAQGDLRAARVNGDAAATGRRPESEPTSGPCPGWARAPAGGVPAGCKTRHHDI